MLHRSSFVFQKRRPLLEIILFFIRSFTRNSIYLTCSGERLSRMLHRSSFVFQKRRPLLEIILFFIRSFTRNSIYLTCSGERNRSSLGNIVSYHLKDLELVVPIFFQSISIELICPLFSEMIPISGCISW